MVGYKDTSGEAKKAAKVAQKNSNNWPMVSFIHNGSEITKSQSKSQNPEQHFKNNNVFFEFQAGDH